MEIIQNAGDNGYFQAQKVNTVKVKDKIGNQKPVTKYYQIKSIEKQNAGNSSSKTK